MAAQMKDKNQISKTIVIGSHDPKRKTIRSDHKYFRFWNLDQNIEIMKKQTARDLADRKNPMETAWPEKRIRKPRIQTSRMSIR